MEYSLDGGRGYRSQDWEPYEDLQNGWFAVLRDNHGQITDVYYDMDHFTHNSLNAKKIVASVISMYVLAHESSYDHEETDSHGSYLAHYTRSSNGTSLIYRAQATTVSDQNLVKQLQKVIEFGQDGYLNSVTMTESVVGNSNTAEGFFASSVIHSETVLKYLSKHPSSGVPSLPHHVATETLDVVPFTGYRQLTQNIKEDIKSTILSCVEVSGKKCIEELKMLFHQVSGSELKQFVEDYINVNTDSPQQVAVLLHALCSSHRKDIGITIADDVLSDLSTDVIYHSLPCLSASKPTSGIVNTLQFLAFDRDDRSTASADLANRAILSLGAAARKLETTDPKTSNEIIERLHLELQKHTS